VLVIDYADRNAALYEAADDPQARVVASDHHRSNVTRVARNPLSQYEYDVTDETL
jgi:hypothetical protein